MATTQQPFEPALKWDAERAWAVPVGAASPMWFAFFGVAATTTSWWWMTRWARELALDTAAAGGGDESIHIPDLKPLADTTIEAVAAVAEDAGLVVDPVVEAPVAIVAETSAAAEVVADDLTRLVGIGPKLAAALAQRGVTSFAQIAAWKGKDLDAIDKALSLKGRAVREAWVSQARRLAGDQP